MSKIFAVIFALAFVISFGLLVHVSFKKEVISQIKAFEAKELNDYKLLTLHFTKGIKKQTLLDAIRKDFPRAKIVEENGTIRANTLCFNVKDEIITSICKNGMGKR